MNLGDHVGDEPARVTANRALLQDAIAAPAVFLRQVHGCEVVTLEPNTPQGTEADACITSHQRLACAIMVADCLPVLLASADGRVVGAAHAGWRGLAGSAKTGVMEAVYESFSALAQQIQGQLTIKMKANVLVWLGPCIGPSAFEVGSEVKAVFEAVHPGAARFFQQGANGKFLCDLAGLARFRLGLLGIEQVYGNDSSPAWCTSGNPLRFYSHRRDASPGSFNSVAGAAGLRTTGRMAACIWLR